MLDAPVGGAVQLRIFRSRLSAPAESPWVTPADRVDALSPQTCCANPASRFRDLDYHTTRRATERRLRNHMAPSPR